MNEENNSGAGLKIIESEVELGERRIGGGNNLIEKIDPVTVPDIIPNEGNILEMRSQYLEKIINIKQLRITSGKFPFP